jgi:hypothetical protein
MPIKQLTTKETEADFEARIHSALGLAFPHLGGTFRHQIKFSISYGKGKFDVGTGESQAGQARADVIIYYKDKALAVLELKQKDLALTADDRSQGVSYAKMIAPIPAPLVIVTNGKEVELYATFGNEIWTAQTATEQAVANLFKNAARAAQADLNEAIQTLMGSNPNIWLRAVREASKDGIADLTIETTGALPTFIPGLLFPRELTKEIRAALGQGKKLHLVQGPPLCGKSHILRKLAEITANEDDLVVLYLNVDQGASICRRVADVLEKALDWRVTEDEARYWIKKLSRSEGPKLVLAIDGMGLKFGDFQREISEMSSTGFGDRLALVVEMGEEVSAMAVVNSSGRGASAIGRVAIKHEVKSFNDDEFFAATGLLEEKDISILRGARFSPEYRKPWILGPLAAHLMTVSPSPIPNAAIRMPPALSLDILAIKNPSQSVIHLERLHKFTEAVLEDVMDAGRSPELKLRSLDTFTVRKKTLRKYLSDAEVDRMVDEGYFRYTSINPKEVLVVSRLTEVTARAAAETLSDLLAEKLTIEAPEGIAKWLSSCSGSLPLGDVIGAGALLSVSETKEVAFEIITSLMECVPVEEEVAEGSTLATHIPGIGMAHLTVQKGGVVIDDLKGRKRFYQFNLGDDAGRTYGNINGWLILSHLAARPFGRTNGNDFYRVDPTVLFMVGQCPHLLRRPAFDLSLNEYSSHDIAPGVSVVSLQGGIIEPITWSITEFLLSGGIATADWLTAVSESGSAALLFRTFVALATVSGSADKSLADYAHEECSTKIIPALRKFPAFNQMFPEFPL